MIQQIKLNGWERLIDFTFLNNTFRPGTDQELFTLQVVFMYTVLDKVLLKPDELQGKPKNAMGGA